MQGTPAPFVLGSAALGSATLGEETSVAADAPPSFPLTFPVQLGGEPPPDEPVPDSAPSDTDERSEKG